MIEADRQQSLSAVRLYYGHVIRLERLADKEGRRGVADILADVIEKGLLFERALKKEWQGLSCPRCRDSCEYQPDRARNHFTPAEQMREVKFHYPEHLRASVKEFAIEEGAKPVQMLWVLIGTGLAYWTWKELPADLVEAEPEYDFG